MRAMVAVSIVLAVLSPALRPVDPAEAVALHYEAPPSCPERDVVRAMVNDTLAALPETENRHVVSAQIVVEDEVPASFRLDLAIDDGTTTLTKTLRGPTCSELTQTAAVLVAIAVDPRIAGLAVAAPALEPPQVDGVVPPAVPADIGDPSAPTEATSQPAVLITTQNPAPLRLESLSPVLRSRVRRARPGLDLRLAGGGGFNLQPGFAGFGTAALGVEGNRWRVEAGVRYWPPKQAVQAQATGRFQLVSMVVRGCAVPSVRTLAFPLCGGASIGGIHGRGVVVDRTAAAWFPWLALTAGPSVRWRLHERVALWFGADVVVAVLRGSFVVQPLREPVHRPGVVGFTTAVGLVIPLIAPSFSTSMTGSSGTRHQRSCPGSPVCRG